jgi:hypothetical protein
MLEINNTVLADAVNLWTGFGSSVLPCRNDNLLIDRFGFDIAQGLINIINYLKIDFYSSKANIIASGLKEMGELSINDFNKKYPDLPNSIGKAFAWCYTFDFK